MIDEDVRDVLEDLRHHFALLNGHYITREASVIDAVSSNDPPVSHAMDETDYEQRIDRVLSGQVSPRVRAALESARSLLLKHRGMTLVDAVAVENRPWIANRAEWLAFTPIVNLIDAAIDAEP